MANPDSTLLSWITAEVKQALSVVREQIAKFPESTGDTVVLHGCSEHLHQVSGALRMVGLNGATRFCEAIEASFAGLTVAKASAQTMALIDQAVLALKDFIEGLERGQPNLPLRLYPVYRELGPLQGKPGLSEKDLFFPDQDRRAPAHPQAGEVSKGDLAAFLQAQRAQFERGLLAWLRKPPSGLQDMAQPVEALHRISGQLPEPQALWWAGMALVQALEANPEGEWLTCARPLYNKLGFQMRDLATGSPRANEALLREVLYAIAKCPNATPLVGEVRQRFALGDLFPAPAQSAPNLELNSELLEAALYDLHSRLESLKSAWEKYVSGEQKAPARFRDLVAAFKVKAGELGNLHLIKILDPIALVAKRLPDPHPPQNQFMVIEMASAFLLVETVIDHFTSPAPDLEHQIVILGGWLLDSAEGKSNGAPPAGLRGDLVQKIGSLQLRAQVSKEIGSNLKHMEQVLDAYARDPSRRESLEGLKSHVRQVQGALRVLGFERAAEVVTICGNMIAACAVVELEQAAEEMDWIAEGLSSVGFYLEPCIHGRDPMEQAIDLFFQRFGKRIDKQDEAAWAQKTSQLAPPEGGAPPAPEPRPGVDPELLAIFLDEADEVLRSIEASVPSCRLARDSMEGLATIRRGFHTLKGSGRMVGLMDLGEVGWEMEQLMNLWLEQKRPASPELLDLIMEAAASFARWVSALREGSLSGEVDGGGLVERARALKGSEEPSFFEIYVKEAAEHLATLEAEFEAWRRAPGTEASPSFMRAAHTLASSSGTAGFNALASLAGALEHTMPFTHLLKEPEDVAPVGQAISRLRAMSGAVARREPAGEGAEAERQLKELIARLQPRAVEKRAMRDDIDAQLLPVFLEEAQQLVPSIAADLRAWKAEPSDEKVKQSLRRALHTLKGSARMAGAIRLGELTHIMESRIEAAIEEQAFPADLFVELEEKMDRLSADVEGMHAPAPPPEVRAEEKPKPVDIPLQAPATMLRINADTLDYLINESGEVAIARSRVEAEVRAIKQSLDDLSESIGRLRGQLREVEIQADSQMQSRLSVLEERKGDYDPLEFDRYTRLQELTRLMAESLNDAVAIQQGLSRNLGEADAALLQQGRTNREVQQALMRMRAVPFANLTERLYRIVRQTARELDKKADLAIEGAEVELDRSVLERIGPPLEHMLRNALAHGVEMPAARAAAGKSETGRIHVTLHQESNEIALVLGDDGDGIDAERLHRMAIEKGIVTADQELTETERIHLVFASGLSTQEEVTPLAGRGVGMDVVRTEVSAIGGRIDIVSTRGQGTTFTLYLPLTLAVTQAVLVRSGASLFAVSTAMVEQVLRLKDDAMRRLYASRQLAFQDRNYPLHSLQQMLGAGSNEIVGYNSVLLLRSGIQRIALHVDALLGNQEIVVKHVGAQLARVAWITGATVLGDGQIVPIINPVVLAQRLRAVRSFGITTLLPAFQEAKPPAAPVVMVVDDSLTVRKITSRLLEREGYRVLTAKDGLDALEQLRDTLPAAMLVDIEMPRMDGFDLTRALRGDPRTRDIPIIIISSRTAEKHRNQAASLGVNAFLGKPYQEIELLQQLSSYVGAAVH